MDRYTCIMADFIKQQSYSPLLMFNILLNICRTNEWNLKFVNAVIHICKMFDIFILMETIFA